MGKYKFMLAVLLVIVSLILYNMFADASELLQVSKNSGDGWSDPVVIYDVTGTDLWNTYATVASDIFGNIHMLWGQTDHEIQEFMGGFYARWDGRVWSTPTDVLVPPLDDRLSGVSPTFAVDANGKIHAIWSGAQPYSLYYTWAWSDQAESAANWSAPVAIGSRSLSHEIKTEGDDTLHVIYTDLGMNVYHVSSHDDGITWSVPVQISMTAPDRSVTDPALCVGNDQSIHVVWTEGPLEGYPPLGVFYSRSDASGMSWSTPTQIFSHDIGEPNIAFAGDNTLHVFANGRAGVGGRFHRYSQDKGQSWSDVQNLAVGDRAGLTAPISLAVDSSGTLHVLYVTEISGIMYTYWEDSTLASPITLVPYEPGVPQRDMEWWAEGAVLTVVGGNQLHVVVPAGYGRKIWHIWRTIDTVPPLPPAPLPDREPVAPASSTPTPLPLPSPNPLPAALTAETTPPSDTSMRHLLMGFLPPLLLAGVVVAVTLMRRKH